MNEIDYDELDKEMGKAMVDDGNKGIIRKRMEAEEEGVEASEMHEKPRTTPARRGRYMDMVHPTSDMRPPARNYSTGKSVKPARKKPDITEVIEDDADDLEFGVIEDLNRDLAAEADFVSEPEAMADLTLEDDFEEEPDANNYSIGGRSPFIPDAKVEKRPLGDDVPENNARSIRSTKNVYSQRTPLEQSVPDIKPMVVDAPKKSGWAWALITLLVILVGGGLGVLAFMIYNSQ